jgi:hypothetical protein
MKNNQWWMSGQLDKTTLDDLPILAWAPLLDYVDQPKGTVCLWYNPDTLLTITYNRSNSQITHWSYFETPAYTNSASNPEYNGNFRASKTYIAK